MEEKQYTITLNKKQASLIAKALEMHSRMICGQLGETYMPPIEARVWKSIKDNEENWSFKRQIVEDNLREIKETLWPELSHGGHWGIGYDEEADLGYEMYKCILSKFEAEREAECKEKGEKYSMNVHTGTPLKLTDQPFIKIEDHE